MALFDSIRLGASAAGDYEIERSIRFNHNDSAYFKRTSVSSPTNVKVWTMSFWIYIDDWTYNYDSNKTTILIDYTNILNNPNHIKELEIDDKKEFCKKSLAILNRAVAIPVFVKMDKDFFKKLEEKL